MRKKKIITMNEEPTVEEQLRIWPELDTDNFIPYHQTFCDSPTMNIHKKNLEKINRFQIGDMVSTAEGGIGLIKEVLDKDYQNFDVYRVIVSGMEYAYSALELSKLEDK